MAHIRKYRDGWRAEVQRHGMRASHLADTKREAQAWAIRKEAELDALKASKGMTLDQAIHKYLTTHAKHNKVRGAAETDAKRFAELTTFLDGRTRLAEIDSETIGRWRDHRLDKVSASTVLRERSLYQGLFTLAVEDWKVISANPFKGLRFPLHNPPRHQVWTWQLIKRVLRARDLTDPQQETVRAFHIALHTAMRMKEIVSANVVGKVAHLERDKTSGKESKPVEIPLPRKGAALYAKYPPFTMSADQVSPIFSSLTDKLLIDGLTFHDARASALTWLSRKMDVMTLARISRHRNLRTLMDTYYRETAEQIAARL